MKLLSVIPILKGTAPETLSYFSSIDVAPGALVRVPVRKKLVPALVVTAREASESKADIRTASFSLKKIDGVIHEHCFDTGFVNALARVADLHAAPIGSVLAALYPQSILEKIDTLTTHHTPHPIESRSETFIIQEPFTERLSRYKALIREAFARNKSIVVVAPTVAEATTLHAELSHGIDSRVALIHSSLPTKKLSTVWKNAQEEPCALCIVGTHHALLIDRSDIDTIILEHESSQFYKQQTRPFVDGRVVVRELATYRSARLVLGDCLVRIETSAPRVEESPEQLRASFRQDVTKPFELVDMTTLTDEYKRAACAPQTLEMLAGTAAMDQRSFVYTLRRGHSSFTICRDCGTVLTCDRCDAPMVLHLNRPQDAEGISEGRSFACHRCGRKRDTHTVCDSCGGWRLEMYGTGVQKVSEEITNALPHVPVFQLSADVATTPAQITKVVTAWKESSNGILVGTDMALAHVRGTQLGLSVVASIDTLLALPDIGMQERVFRLVCELRDMAERTCVQTRTPSAPALEVARSGNGWELYQREITNRKALNYPPYTTLIKITRGGTKEAIMHDLEELKKLCEPYQTLIYPAFVSRIKNQHTAHLLIIVPNASWPDTQLIEALRSLPPTYAVNVAPESIL